MKVRSYLITLIILTSLSVFSQDFKKVDEIVKSYPKTFETPDSLSVLINRDFSLPEEKVRAIYTWIAVNIAYDVKYKKSDNEEIYSYKTSDERFIEYLAQKTLDDKKAVCEGYSALFKVLCDLTSIECQIIRGKAKTNLSDIGETFSGTNHAWNAVKIGKKWKLIDVTWGAGFVYKGGFIADSTDSYFFTDPEIFFLKHYPKDDHWLLTKKSEKEFTRIPLYYRDFFDSKIEFIKPNKGIIKIRKNKPLKVVMRNSQNVTVSFKFNDEQKSTKIEPKIDNDLCYYNVNPGPGMYLTIYVNYFPFISYKIKKPLKVVADK